MRTVILVGLMMVVTAANAQSVMNNFYPGTMANNLHVYDTSQSKWSLSRFSAISTSFTFFKGGNAAIVSAPIGLQLNRRLNNNLYAFAAVLAAPAYVSFNRSFIANEFNKSNQNGGFYKPGNLGLYSRAELGLQYVNDEKTFSISGSIGVERSSYPVLRYDHMNNTRPAQLMPVNNR